MMANISFYDLYHFYSNIKFSIFDENDVFISDNNATFNVDRWSVSDGIFSSLADGNYQVIIKDNTQIIGKEDYYWDGDVLYDGFKAINKNIRLELNTELLHLISLQNGLTTTQATQLLELYLLMGLDPTKPLVVTTTKRTVDVIIDQDIVDIGTQTTITRN